MSKQVTESTLSKVNRILQISDSYEAPARVLELLKDEKDRKNVFFSVSQAFDYDLSYEWFYNSFRTRRRKATSRTSRSVSNLISEMLNCKVVKMITIISGTGRNGSDHCSLGTNSSEKSVP